WRSRATAPTGGRPRERSASPGLLVRRVAAAPAAVLAQLDPVRIVALRLLALVVAPLALLASQRHGDSNVPAGHGLPGRFRSAGPAKKRPRRGREVVAECSVRRPPARCRGPRSGER